jgi:hypothetical protein
MPFAADDVDDDTQKTTCAEFEINEFVTHRIQDRLDHYSQFIAWRGTCHC